jgi:type IV pilus assembly protein PilB
MRDMIAANMSNNALQEYAINNGMTTLKQESIRLILDGITSFNEVMDITFSI